MKLQFLGADRQVTGSQYYLHTDGADPGRLRHVPGAGVPGAELERPPGAGPATSTPCCSPTPTSTIAGCCPSWSNDGFRGPILATPATVDLAELVLRDSAHIQAEDAAFKQKRHRKEGRRGNYPGKAALHAPRRRAHHPADGSRCPTAGPSRSTTTSPPPSTTPATSSARP